MEVYQFARDAAVAEGWLMAQESYLTSHELGVSICYNKTFCLVNSLIIFIAYFQQTIDEVENLIKKHEAFEKSAAAQEERFAALERLTTVRDFFSLFYNFLVQSISAAYASIASYLYELNRVSISSASCCQ